MYNVKKEFNDLVFGDIILARRIKYNVNIDEGHENGPFLVIGRDDDKLICLYSTSKEKKCSLIKIPQNNFGLSKDTYVTSKVRKIYDNQYIKHIYSLSDVEKKNLNKLLFINGLEASKFLDEVPIEIGDIVKLTNYHLIVGEQDDKYLTLRAKYYEDIKTYRYNYGFKDVIYKSNQVKRVAFLSEDEIKQCLAEANGFYAAKKVAVFDNTEFKKDTNPLRVGNLVLYDKLLYYLYYNLDGKYFAFKVNKTPGSNSCNITIDGVSYCAYFKKKKDFNQNQENVSYVSRATTDEEKEINFKRRNIR